jgi:hypothetical protein
MTDQELIARLLAEETDLTDCAADRIEELLRENAEMAAAITEAENGGLCSGGNLWRFWSKTAREIAEKSKENREKLAKAVEALRKIADHKHFSWDQGWIQNTEARIARAALAELEKRND